jgi:hypothetical protein
LRGGAKAGRQLACTFDTLIYPEPETSVSTSRTWSGLSSNDGIGLVCKLALKALQTRRRPARTALISSTAARMAADIAPRGIFGKPEMPDLRDVRADED